MRANGEWSVNSGSVQSRRLTAEAGKVTMYPDQQQRGLALCVSPASARNPAGVKSWTFRFYPARQGGGATHWDATQPGGTRVPPCAWRRGVLTGSRARKATTSSSPPRQGKPAGMGRSGRVILAEVTM